MFGNGAFGEFAIGDSGGGSGPPVPTPIVTSVVVNPSTATGATTFQAQVLGLNSPSQAVTWEAEIGTISSVGAFVPPSATGVVQVGTVTARSVQDPAFVGTAVVTIAAVNPDPDPDPDPDPEEPDERNYAWLQAEVIDWMRRPGENARVPKFIMMAEARLNRVLQARGMEIETTLTFAPGVGAVRLPAGFDTPLAAWRLEGSGRCELSAVVPEQLPGTQDRGTPSQWAISGTYLALDKPVAKTERITLRYRGLLRLSDAAPNNSVLSKYPDVYIYGALMEAAMHIRDREQAADWSQLYEQAIKELNRNESRSRAHAPLRTELAGLVGRCR